MAVKKKPEPTTNPGDQIREEIEALSQRELARIQDMAGDGDLKLAGMIVIGLSSDGALPMGIVGMDHGAALQVLQGAAMAVEEAALEARLAQIRAARGAAA